MTSKYALQTGVHSFAVAVFALFHSWQQHITWTFWTMKMWGSHLCAISLCISSSVYCSNHGQKTETGVTEAQWVVNYEIDITHIHSLLHNYTSVSYFTRVSGSLGPSLFPRIQMTVVGCRFVWREATCCSAGSPSGGRLRCGCGGRL